jgi:hypothetical protein
MSPHARAVAAAFVAMQCCSTITEGQMPPASSRPIQLLVSGGLTLPAGDLGDLHDSGFHYDASLLLNLPGFPVRIRPEFSLTQLKLKDSLLGGGSTDDVTSMYAALGNIELPLSGGLYLLAGGGIMSLSLPDGASTGSGESASKLTFDAGAGYRFRLGGASGFVEARMGTASYDQGKFGFSKAQLIPVSFGLAF